MRKSLYGQFIINSGVFMPFVLKYRGLPRITIISVTKFWRNFIDLGTFKKIYEHETSYELFMNLYEIVT